MSLGKVTLLGIVCGVCFSFGCSSDADDELLSEVKELLWANGIKKVSHFEGVEMQHIRCKDAPKATTLGKFYMCGNSVMACMW